MNIPDKIVLKNVSDLRDYSGNARTHSDSQIAQLQSSIRQFGWTNPLLVDGDDEVIAGHGRLEAARRMGAQQVPCIVLTHLSPTQRRALVLADNQIALNAGWNEELLRKELQSLKDMAFDLALTGFSEDELADLMEGGEKNGLTDPDAAPDLQAVAISEPGDIWILGPHRVACSDATEDASVEQAMGGGRTGRCLLDRSAVQRQLRIQAGR